MFSLRPPPAVGAEVDEAGAKAMIVEILNYGVTFASEKGLELVDKYLHQHACFSIPTSESACCMPKLTMARPDDEENLKVYWTPLAPKVEDYNTMLGKAIAAGLSRLSRGFSCVAMLTPPRSNGGRLLPPTTDKTHIECVIWLQCAGGFDRGAQPTWEKMAGAWLEQSGGWHGIAWRQEWPIIGYMIKRLVEPERGHIGLVELPLPSMEGLPHGTESTADVPNKMIPLLLNAVDMWENPFKTLLRQLCPHCIIHDFAQCWTPRLAAKLGIPSIFFLTLGRASSSLFHVVSRGLDENIEAQNLTTPSPEHPHDNSSILQRSIGQLVFPVAPSSVIHVSMGSECFPSQEQIHALALALDASHGRFAFSADKPTRTFPPTFEPSSRSLQRNPAMKHVAMSMMVYDAGDRGLECGEEEEERIKWRQPNWPQMMSFWAAAWRRSLWPLTKYEPTIKLYSSHYMFSLRPPPAVGAEVDEAGAKAMIVEILNYGVTFASEKGLELVDKYLHQHACFSIPTSESACCMPKLTMARPDDEENLKVYWTPLAPKVEDYNTMLGKAIAAGLSRLSRGFSCVAMLTPPRCRRAEIRVLISGPSQEKLFEG
eukprot:Gb_25836 [translate_table: standard]